MDFFIIKKRIIWFLKNIVPVVLEFLGEKYILLLYPNTCIGFFTGDTTSFKKIPHEYKLVQFKFPEKDILS